MKEIVTPQQSNHPLTNHFATNNGNPTANNVANGNNQRRYAVLSTEWISTIGEELGMHPLPDSVLKRLAEDASYRLREVLHKCATRLKHSKRKKLTSTDVNAVITNLCDADPVLGTSDQMPIYHNEAKVFVPQENFIDLTNKSLNPTNFSQSSSPFIQETEICDVKLVEARHSYAKKALKTLFNGSQKTFQVLLNDCASNPHLGGEGVVDTLISTARSTVISNNAQYTRVTTRTCQLIIAIACNSEAVYPYHLYSVEKLTELLLELLLGSSFINSHVESLFKTCALKLMLRWPSVADKFIPMLEKVLIKEERASDKKRLNAMELLAGVQPLTFFQYNPEKCFPLNNVFDNAPAGSVVWERLALSVCAFAKSRQQGLNISDMIEHFGDSILPYLTEVEMNSEKNNDKNQLSTVLPIIVRSKIKYAIIRPILKNPGDKQIAFPDSSLRGPRREIRFAFAGGRPVPPSNLRRTSLRASYQILRSDVRATTAVIACRRLLILKDKKKNVKCSYNLAHIHL